LYKFLKTIKNHSNMFRIVCDPSGSATGVWRAGN